MLSSLLLVTALLTLPPTQASEAMNQQELERIVKSITPRSVSQPGAIEFFIEDRRMLLLVNSRYDRMRIITPITEYEKLSPEQISNAMQANFHSALDARYAVSNDVLYSAFIHPLSPLSEGEVRSAIIQVFNLASSFGTAYTSGVLDFDPGQSSQAPAPNTSPAPAPAPEPKPTPAIPPGAF